MRERLREAEPMTDDTVVGPELEECPVCGALGLPERIDDHDCEAFREHQQRQ